MSENIRNIEISDDIKNEISQVKSSIHSKNSTASWFLTTEERLVSFVAVFHFLITRYSNYKGDCETKEILQNDWNALKVALTDLEPTINKLRLDSIHHALINPEPYIAELIEFLHKEYKGIISKTEEMTNIGSDASGIPNVVTYENEYIIDHLTEYISLNTKFILASSNFREYASYFELIISDVELQGENLFQEIFNSCLSSFGPKPKKALLCLNEYFNIFTWLYCAEMINKQPTSNKTKKEIKYPNLTIVLNNSTEQCYSNPLLMVRAIRFWLLGKSDNYNSITWKSENIVDVVGEDKYDYIVTQLPVGAENIKTLRPVIQLPGEDGPTTAVDENKREAAIDSQIVVCKKLLSLLCKNGEVRISFDSWFSARKSEASIRFRRYVIDSTCLASVERYSGKSVATISNDSNRPRSVVFFDFSKSPNKIIKERQEYLRTGMVKGKYELIVDIPIQDFKKYDYSLSMDLWNKDYLKLKEELGKYKDTLKLEDVCTVSQSASIALAKFVQESWVQNTKDRTTYSEVLTEKSRGNIPLITADSLKEEKINYSLIRNYIKKVNIKADALISQKVILIGRKGMSRKTLVVEYDPIKSKYKNIAVGADILVLYPNEKKINFSYLKNYLRSDVAQKQIYLFAIQENRLNEWPDEYRDIDPERFSKISIPWQSADEQLAFVDSKNKAYREDILEENKLLKYINEIKFFENLDETMMSFEKYVKEELGGAIKVRFKGKTDFDSLLPFTSEDIKEGTYYKVVNKNESALLVHVDLKPYGVVLINGKGVDWKITQDMEFRFVTVASFIVRFFQRIKEESAEMMANFVAHEVKNDCGLIINNMEIIKKNIDTEKHFLNEKEIEEQVAIMGTKKEDYVIGSYFEKTIQELEKLNNIADYIYYYGKNKIGAEIETLDLTDVLKHVIQRKNVRMNMVLRSKALIAGARAPIERAIENFITNAIENSPAHACEVELMESGEGIIKMQIINKTSGPIPKDLLANLGKKPIKSKKGGVGYILSKQIIENNNGSANFKYNKEKNEFIVELEFIKKGA